jgi:glycosyltransferase involved in cell wall biosynthesis
MLRHGPSTRPRVVDARWLGYTGVGRVTRLLLVGLGELRPPGEWVVWGPPSAGELTWPGAVHIRAEHSPLTWFGQRSVAAVPDGQFLALHLVRPFVIRRKTVVLAHDTIPVRWARPWARRAAQRVFYAVSARTARSVLVYSDATAEHVRRDLRLPSSRVHRIDLTVDLGLAERVRHRRQEAAPSADRLLYVGLDEPHKNLDRSVAAFAASELGRQGGSFHLLGAADDTLDDLIHRVAGSARVVVHPRCTDDELVDHYASASALIQPSFDEGFGLTVVEALAGHVPVCCSAGGALEEAAAGAAELFDPHSVASMAAAIDRTVGAGDWPARFARFLEARPLPSPREFAAQIVAALDAASS